VLRKTCVGLRAASLAIQPKELSDGFFTIEDVTPFTGDLVLLCAACSSQPCCYITCPSLQGGTHFVSTHAKPGRGPSHYHMRCCAFWTHNVQNRISTIVGFRASSLAIRPKERSHCIFTIGDVMPLTGMLFFCALHEQPAALQHVLYVIDLPSWLV